MTKILVIEDNPVNMKLAVLLLKTANYEVFQAKDAEAGLELIRKHRPEVVLMDIQLPGMDGLTATRIVKADPILASTKIIALTAHAMKGDEGTMLAAGCDDYLAKPVHHKDLLSMVKRVLL